MTEPSPIQLSTADAGTRSAGEMLRRAREAQGITLEGLASTIKVTPAKLDALESGRIEQLPDANFARALAMTVCRALKIDSAPVMAAMPAGKPMTLATGRPPLNQPFKEAKGGSPLFDRSFDGASLLNVKYLAPVVLLVGAVLIYVLPDSVIDVSAWRRHWARPNDAVATNDVNAAPPAGSVPQMQAASVAAPVAADRASMALPLPSAASPLVLDNAQVPAASGAMIGASAALVPAPAAPGLAGASGQVAPVASEASDPRLTASPTLSAANAANSAKAAGEPSAAEVLIEAREPAWIEVKDASGDKLLSRHVKAGESVKLEGEPPFKLRVGNAPAVTVTYKGQPVDLAPSMRNDVARLELK